MCMLSSDLQGYSMALSENDTENLDFVSLLPMIYSLVINGPSMKDHELTRMQLMLLLALSRRERLLMSRVAEYMSSSREQTTRAVEHLVKEGYVERLHDETNRTHVFIQLTPAGRKVVSECHDEFRARIRRSFEGKLTEEEVSALKGHIAETVHILDKVV